MMDRCFFFNDTATTEIYTLSLHDALPISGNTLSPVVRDAWDTGTLRNMTKNSPATATGAHVSIISHITIDELQRELSDTEDRKSTRLNSSHANISYAVFCLKQKKIIHILL